MTIEALVAILFLTSTSPEIAPLLGESAALQIERVASIERRGAVGTGWRGRPVRVGHWLSRSAAHGDVERVGTLLRWGMNVDHPGGEDGMTALFAAARFGRLDVVEVLLVAGADPNHEATSFHGRYPLDHATYNGHVEVVRRLLAAGADVDGERALERAMAVEPVAEGIAQLLLERGADPNRGHAMVLAAERASVELLREMLDRGGDPTHQEFYGGVLARACGSLDKVKLLVERGAPVHGHRQNGVRPIHAAAQLGNIGVAEFLRSAGADLEVTKADGQSPLDLAIRFGRSDMVRWLVGHGLASELNSTTFASRIALDDHEAVATMLEQRSDLRDAPVPGDYPPPPIHTAVRFGAISSLQLLLDAGADPDERLSDVTPLHLAARLGDLAAAKALIAAGADPSPKFDPHRYGTGLLTPLHTATARFDRPNGREFVELLVRSGADVHARSEMGKSPLDLARRSADPTLRRIFGLD